MYFIIFSKPIASFFDYHKQMQEQNIIVSRYSDR